MSTPRPSWHIALPLLATLVLFGIWSAYWAVAFRAARSAFDDHRATLQSRGIILKCAAEAWGGYPFRFEYGCQSPAAILPDFGQIRAARLQAVAQAYQPWHILLLLDGPTEFIPHQGSPVSAAHGRTIASLSLKDPSQPVLTVEVPDLRIPNMLDAKTLLASLRQRGSDTYDIAADATAIKARVPDKPDLILDHLMLDATITAPTNLQFNSSSLAQGTLQAAATGHLALDAARKPIGEIQAQTNDAQALLAAAAPYLDLTDTQRQQATVLLKMLGQKATLAAHDGGLYLGPLRLMDLPPVY